jgi:8-oxo-dGTP pyrophosphatase MutT (NUDIX family)
VKSTPRRSAKVILVDRNGHTLLFRGGDPSRPEAGSHWFPPGGAIEQGETDEEAAVREVREETGLELRDVGPVLARRRATFSFEGQTYDSDEVYYMAEVDRFDVDETGWTDIERRAVFEYRWWSSEELASTEEIIYPEGLLELIRNR